MVIEKHTKDHYFINLINELKRQEIEVIFPRKEYKNLFLFRNLLFSKTRILHIHFLYSAGFYAKTLLQFILKYFIFIIDIYLVKYILKTKIIWTVHNLYSHKAFFPKIEKLGKNFFSKKVNYIICHCKNAKRLVQKEFGVNPAKIHIIPHGNYINSYKNSISREVARKKLNLHNDDFIFLFFGRIRPYKGVGNLIKSFKSIHVNENLKLLIVGKVFKPQISKILIENTLDDERIILNLKRIPDDAIQIYMNASDVVVTPYIDVLTSGQVLLAMSFGKPIIAPKLGCIIDILDEKGSFIYNPDVSNSLLQSLEKAITLRTNLLQMGNYNLELVKKFDWKRIVVETIEIYLKSFK
ncbi:MAG: glycosyltransferase family 4 protein [Promethearchaeota archaeon]